MPTERKMYKCKDCGRRTEHLVPKPSHLLHFFLSLVTLGAWLLVWALVAIFRGSPECTRCGKKYRGFRVA